MSKCMCEKWRGAIFTLNLSVNGSLVPCLTDTINFKLYLHYLAYTCCEFSTCCCQLRELSGVNPILQCQLFLTVLQCSWPPHFFFFLEWPKRMTIQGKTPKTVPMCLIYTDSVDKLPLVGYTTTRGTFEDPFLHFPNNKKWEGTILCPLISIYNNDRHPVFLCALCFTTKAL